MTENIRICLFFISCGKKEVYNGKKWIEHWRHYKNKVICHGHYNTIIGRKTENARKYKRKYNVEIQRARVKKNDIRRLKFLGKRVSLPYKIRTGFCNWCTNNIFDKTCKRTNMHHLFYVSIMPWACTVEVCSSCHGKVGHYVT